VVNFKGFTSILIVKCLKPLCKVEEAYSRRWRVTGYMFGKESQLKNSKDIAMYYGMQQIECRKNFKDWKVILKYH